MKHLKGLIIDTRPQEQPEGTYRFGKNGIQQYLKGSAINEPGLLISPAVVPGKTIGIVETDRKPVFISVAEGNTFVGFYDKDAEVYENIFNDVGRDFKLKLKPEWYVKGEFQRNYRNELIIVITDKNNDLYTINCDRASEIANLNDILFFLEATPPTIEVIVQDEGSLPTGAYYVFAKYTRNDGAETAYIANSDVKTVSNSVLNIGDKSLQITLNNLDPRYDKVQLAIISKIGGVMSALEIEPLPIGDASASLVYNYTGSEITTPATVQDILAQPAVYRTVGALGQLNDSLYMADLTTDPEIEWQQYASLLSMSWVAEEIDVLGNTDALVRGEFKTYIHMEAYAFYVRLLTVDGKRSRAFHVPGRPLTTADRAPSLKGTVVGITQPKFQLEDTIPAGAIMIGGQLTGQFGAWENETETYPNDPAYDATSIGGRDLRGQKVLHHRFPSHEFTKPFFSKEHGRSSLDRLGVKINNVVIPANLQGRIVGIELLYAKRTGENMTVMGQSTINMDSYAVGQGLGGDIFTAGGNWRTTGEDKNRWGDFNDGETLLPRSDYARFYPFDMLFNKPSVSIDYIKPITFMRHRQIGPRHSFENGWYGASGKFLGYLLDYTQKTDVDIPTTPFNGQILKMEEGKYIPYNSVTGRYRNLYVGTSYAGKITPFTAFTYYNQTYNVQTTGNAEARSTRPDKMVQIEETALCSLMKIRSDLYSTFYLQTLITTGTTIKPDGSPTVVWGGDGFLCTYTFNTFGYVDAHDKFDPMRQARVVRRIVCEATSNINARYEITAEPNSRFFPKSSIQVPTDGTPENYVHFIDNKREVNIFGYSKDLNALNELTNVRPWFPSEDNNIIDFPYRIHRGGKISRTGKIRNWQTLLPLDYYEAQKNMGRIINLCGMNDRLIIHHENALFVTQDKTKLESDIISVTLGSGDIFQFEPQEVQYSKLGFGGSQHDLACLLTPIGYLFIDSKQGQVFLYNGDLKPMNLGYNTFLREALKVPEKNIFMGNGITFGYDPEYNRIFLVVKNRKMNQEEEPVRFDYTPTAEFFATLVPGISLVYKDGRVQRFIGPNQSSYQCLQNTIPILEDVEYTVLERAPAGTFIGTIQVITGGVGPYSYFIMNPDPAIQLEAATGTFRVQTPPVYTGNGLIILQIKAVDAIGQEAFAQAKIQVIRVPKGPTVPDYEFTVPESQPPRLVGQVVAIAGDDPALTYTITAGNDNNAFAVDGSGTLSTTGPLNYNVKNQYNLEVTVTDSQGNSAISHVTVEVIEIPDPPVFTSKEFTIFDTHPLGGLVGTMDAPSDPDGDSDLLVTTIVGFNEGVFDVNLETLAITLSTGAELDPLVKNRYEIHFRTTDESGLSTDAVAYINVRYDTALYQFAAFGYKCSGGGCPPPSTVSPDGSYCVTVEDSTATPPAETLTAYPRTLSPYSMYGSFIYADGFNVNGRGIRTKILASNPWWRNIPANTTDGPLNRTGLWNGPAIGSNHPPYNTWIGFTTMVNILAEKVYYIGLGGDNECRIKLNGVTIVQQVAAQLALQSFGNIDAAFKEWHIYPVRIPAGVSVITLEGQNFGGQASFGAEIYDNTQEELMAALSYSNLNLIWSSKDYRTGVIPSGSYTCADSTAQVVDTGSGLVCRKITRVEKTATTKVVTSVKVTSSRWANRILAVVPNVSGQEYDEVPVPFYPDVTNSAECAGSLFTNTDKSAMATKNDCGTGLVGSPVQYIVPAGDYTSQVNSADAETKAQQGATFGAQRNANLSGTCSTDPTCPQVPEFTIYKAGPWCVNDEVQYVIRHISGNVMKTGIAFYMEWRDADGVVIYTNTTNQIPAGQVAYHFCMPDGVNQAETVEIINVLC